MKTSIYLVWFAFWFGAYWDTRTSTLFVCPFPFVVVKLEFFPLHCPACGGDMLEHDTCYDECGSCDFFAIYYDDRPDRVWTRREIWREYRHAHKLWKESQ